MKSIKSLQLAIFMAFVGLPSCVSYQIPKEYVPDDKVVYLKQKVEFGPVHYDPVAADPYKFEPDGSPVNAEKPTFLSAARWENLLKADFKADSRLLREVEAHARFITGLDSLKRLRSKLDAASISITPPLPPNQGELVKEYTNATSYKYPDAAGAQITIMNNGDYQIEFADKGKFAYWTDGSYQRTDAKGGIIFQYASDTSYVLSTVDGTKYFSRPGMRGLEEGQFSLEYHEEPHEQYRFALSQEKGAANYTIFVDKDRSPIAVAIRLGNGIRFDYFIENKSITAAVGAQVIVIQSDYEKAHHAFDEAKRMPTSLLSLYLPEGIRLTNFDGSSPAYAEVNSAWPEQYKQKTIGPFNFLYTAKDEQLVSRLRADRLADLETKVRSISGLSGAQRRTIVVPPNLDSYRKLHASEPGEKLLWYPSGFETKDIIVMWPFSADRYDKPEGQKYFFEQEIYEILSHEYVHVLVGENTGLLSPTPVWLNEGLAVYVESELSPDTATYWDVTFDVARGLNRLLDWDLVTTTSTGELEIAKARVHYAQSYAMVKALVKKFGAAKVASYVRSFRVKSADYDKTDLKTSYKTNFKNVFGIEWKDALELLKPEEKKST